MDASFQKPTDKKSLWLLYDKKEKLKSDIHALSKGDPKIQRLTKELNQLKKVYKEAFGTLNLAHLMWINLCLYRSNSKDGWSVTWQARSNRSSNRYRYFPAHRRPFCTNGSREIWLGISDPWPCHQRNIAIARPCIETLHRFGWCFTRSPTHHSIRPSSDRNHPWPIRS